MSARGLGDIEFQPSLLLVTFGTLSAAAILAAPSILSYVGLQLLCVFVVFIVLILLYRSDTFIMRLLNLSYQHDDTLADSLAVKMTGDPEALKSAIRKVEAETRRIGRVPGGTILSRYLFVTPPSAPGDYFRYTTKIAGEALGGTRVPRTWLLFDRPINRAMKKVLELESRMTEDRLVNIDLIEQGRWRALEDWIGE